MTGMKTQTARPDSWASGESYQRYIGRWSEPVAAEFIRWLDVPAGRHWLDLGCGTGALSRGILERASPASVWGVDPSESHISFARESLPDQRATFAVGSAESVPRPSDSVDVVVSGLVLNFLPDPARGLAEMTRLTHSGGTISAYVWDYADKMELLRCFWDAAVALDRAARAIDEGTRFPLCRPENLKGLWAEGNLRNVEVRAIDVPTGFRDFNDLWEPFLGGQGPAPGYAMSLDEEKRSRLRDLIQSALPIAADGSITLVARAWAVKGRKL